MSTEQLRMCEEKHKKLELRLGSSQGQSTTDHNHAIVTLPPRRGVSALSSWLRGMLEQWTKKGGRCPKNIYRTISRMGTS